MARVHPAPTPPAPAPPTPPAPCTLVTPVQIHNAFDPIDTAHYSWSVRWMFFYMKFKKAIHMATLLVLLLILLMIILLSLHRSTSDNPCIIYQSDTLASQVSLACFRYLWSRSCSQPLPDGYDGGWWLRSPNGGRMVPCLAPHAGTQCGAGSYSSIATYLYRCRINEDGL